MQPYEYVTKGSRVALVVAIAAIMSTTACGKGQDKAPEGQVVAKLQGQDITQLEVDAELARMNVPESMERRTAEKIALQNIIIRRMLANTAVERKLDKTPNYIMTARRTEEQLKIQALANDVRAKVNQPTGDEVRNYMDAHPGLFRERKIYLVDQIQFVQPEDAEKLDVEKLNTLDQIEQLLVEKNIKYQRRNTGMDVLTISPDFLKQVQDVLKKDPNEVFIFTNRPANAPAPVIYANHVTGSETRPFLGKEASEYTTNRLYGERVQDALRKQMEVEREKAKGVVTYQRGWEPDEDQQINPEDVTGNANETAAKAGTTPATN